MFEKSKSEISFKEMKHKLNTSVNFENDWGHFCDPDNNDNNIFQSNLYYQKKSKIKPKSNTERKIEKIEKPFVDIEKSDKNEIIIKLEHKEDDTKNIIVEIVFDYIKKVFITFTMVYFIFKVI